MSVKVKIVEDKVLVYSPYSVQFVAEAKRLGGRFNAIGKFWYFDQRDEERVRELCRDIYGTDGEEKPEDLVDVRLTVTEHIVSHRRSSISWGGRELVKGFGRDSGTRMGHKVILISGDADTGGSAKNWDCRINAGSILEIRDVPKAALNIGLDAHCGELHFEIITKSDESKDAEREALLEEKRRLLARLAEIEEALQPKIDLEAIKPQEPKVMDEFADAD